MYTNPEIVESYRVNEEIAYKVTDCLTAAHVWHPL